MTTDPRYCDRQARSADTEPDRVLMACSVCGRDVWVLLSVAEGPSARNMHCDDCFFERFGDMLSINELRRSNLTDPENRQLRDKYLAQYEQAGLDPDQDPSSFEITVLVAPDDTVDDFFAGAIAAATDAIQLRLATPEDFTDA